jgi:pilus assembly protein CpaF
MEQMIKLDTLTQECAEYLETLVECGYNIFISGGTSSGKTTFLNALSEYIPKRDRVIIVEDSQELQMSHITNRVQMECHNANSLGQGAVSMDMLIRTSLRMRPDRIIVGEVRGREVSDMLQAMNTGHDGSMSTGHGNSVRGMLRRLEAMYLMSANIPMDAIRAQIVEGIDVMVHLGRTPEGRRMVIEVQELLDFRNGEYKLNPLFTMNDDMKLKRTDSRLIRRSKLQFRGADYGDRL